MPKSPNQIFCPTLDSTLIAAIINDYPDFDTCFDILNSLAEEANSVLDAEGKEILIENELSSGNSSSNFRSSSVPSFSETGDGSITSLECSIDGLSVEDELDYESTCSTTDYDFEYPEGSAEFLKTCFPMLSEPFNFRATNYFFMLEYSILINTIKESVE
ncbi:hypothetical protein C1645_323011 [Glomus cerebriforme]|uniref:Uncharacterized protein n=1 Tax=Glomus cerebriforme TaxID=658196 RepID=A0A397TQB7_9GLOM|nr:hypothetical protein C1645_323011 [Glomus cerebriforme]